MKSFIISRHIMFFRTGEVVSLSKLGEYFTKKAIEKYVAFGYIKEIKKDV